MLKIFHWIFGFVVLRIDGEYADFLNRAIKKHITLWNICYDDNCLTVHCSVLSFRRLRKISRKSAYSIHITERYGLCFIIARYRLRYGLVVGFALFFLILYYLSSYIWIIKVDGNQAVRKNEILAACENFGIRTGVFSRKIDCDNAALKIMISRNDLGFVSFSSEGSILTVSVSETLAQKSKADQPGNLIAGCDGIIRGFDLTGGSPVVKYGSAVKKGDLLVSGINECGTSLIYETAAGKVFATVQESITTKTPEKITVSKPNGRLKYCRTLCFFHLNIPLNFEKNFTVDSISQDRYYLFHQPMPIYFEKQTQYCKNSETSILDNETAERYLITLAEKETKQKGITDYHTINQTFSKKGNNYYFTRQIEHETDIAEFKPIIFVQ